MVILSHILSRTSSPLSGAAIARATASMPESTVRGSAGGPVERSGTAARGTWHAAREGGGRGRGGEEGAQASDQAVAVAAVSGGERQATSVRAAGGEVSGAL